MANPQESALQYPLGETLPEPGRAIEVAPGVRWLRMRLPFALDHINLWLLRDRLDGQEGWTIVDCGIADEATRALWEQVFAHELQGLPVLRLVVTHMHPDHIGLAHWLTERWATPQRECRLWISSTDWNAARVTSQTTSGNGGAAAADFFARHGLTDPEALAKVRARSNYYASMVPQVPRRYGRLMDGMVLPRISTNVSVIDLEPEASPLALYLRSLEAMRGLSTRTLVLPSHGKPFIGLQERITQLQQHHEERLAEVLQACAEAPHSAAELLMLMFKRPLDLHQTTFAMGEAIAHLHLLADDGRLVPVNSEDGVRRYRTASAAPAAR